MSNHWSPDPDVRTVSLAECGRETPLDLHDLVWIEHPDEPYLVLVMGATHDHAGAKFTHPNIVRSRDKDFSFKHYHQDGGKSWTQEAGREHVFVVPRTAIKLRLVVTTGNPELEICGEVVRLNTSWGTWGKGHAADFIYDEVTTCVNSPVKTLKAVANAAVRGSHFEPYLFHDEKEGQNA